MVSLKTDKWQLDGVESVIFDKDGTLIDLHYLWGKITELRALELIKNFNLNDNYFKNICSFLGYDINSKKMNPNGITAMYSRVKIIELLNNYLNKLNVESSIELIEKIFDDVTERFNKDLYKYIKPIGEAFVLAQKLKEKGVKLGIVPADTTKATEQTLKHLGYEKLFDIIIGRESSTHTKESGIPTLIALEKLSANANNTIMIGDSPTDKISASNAGIKRTILVSTGQLDIDRLKKYSEYVINYLNELFVL